MLIHTKCQGCVFAMLENNSQEGCKLDRLSKLDFHKNDNYYESNRFCNTYRPDEWLADLSVAESLDIENVVMNEVRPRVGFMIIFEKNMQTLKETIEDIKSQSMQAGYVVVINDAVEYNSEIQELLVNTFDEDTKHHIVQVLKMPSKAEFLIDEAFKHATNGWVYVCHAGESIRKDIVESIHTRINISMKPLVIVRPYDDNLNGLIFQAALFKFLNGNKSKIFQDEKIDSRLFLEKVKQASERSGPETYISWGEFIDEEA